MKGDVEIMKCHTNREAQRFKCLFVLEYNKKPCIGEKDIYKERETEICSHTNGDDHKIFLSEYTEKKEVKSNDGEKFENSEGIADFKNGKKIQNPPRDSVSQLSFGIGRIGIT